MKSTEMDVKRGEGLPMGKKSSGASHDNEKSWGGPMTGSKYHAPLKTKKSTDGDVMRGEGLAMGTKKGGGSHEDVRQPKHVHGATQASRANQQRREMGNADPEGGW